MKSCGQSRVQRQPFASSSSHCLPLTRNRRNPVVMVARLPTPPLTLWLVWQILCFQHQKADGAVLDPPGCQINLLPLGASRFLGYIFRVVLFKWTVVLVFTHRPSSFTISARMAGVDLAFLFSSTKGGWKLECYMTMKSTPMILLILREAPLVYLGALTSLCQAGRKRSLQSHSPVITY